MSTIFEDVKTGQLKHIYVLCGSEGYLRRSYMDYLKNALCKDLDSMNINVYKGKDINVAEMIELADTLPFFADRRVIILENTELFGSAGEKLADYMAELPESVYFLINEENADKRSRLYKVCNSKGSIVECELMKEPDLRKWVNNLLGKDHKRIADDAYHLYVEKTCSDMNNMRQELEKLVSYVGEREVITTEDVEAVCTTRVGSKIFDLIDAVAVKDQKKALDVYADMLEMRESPVAILSLIGRQFNMILQAKELRAKGYSGDALADKLGLRYSFHANKYLSQAAKFTVEELKMALEDCVQTDENFKMGKITDRLGVEMLIVKYSGKKK